ncbi:MAG: lytic transglycosylase domain-containing protein [Patulibacter sp.]|nr:lytic transglycosylase domain-containing protein [Patulibacter sp.]
MLVLGALVGLVVVAVLAFRPEVQDAVDTIRLPIGHTELIREQAKEKDLDPALVAAVIYAESRFRDNQESSAGAMGLMQVTPETASDIARESGASSFEVGDLHTAEVNVRYGTWRLRDMLRRFDGDVALAAAGYNAGPGNAAKWKAEADAKGEPFRVDEIPFPETRHYVEKVLQAQEDYRKTYPKELGLR